MDFKTLMESDVVRIWLIDANRRLVDETMRDHASFVEFMAKSDLDELASRELRGRRVKLNDYPGQILRPAWDVRL